MNTGFTKTREIANDHNLNPYIIGVSRDKRKVNSITIYDKTFNLDSEKDYFQVYDIDGRNIQIIQSFVDYLTHIGKHAKEPEFSDTNTKLGYTSGLVDLVARAYLDNAQLFGQTSKGEETFNPKPHSEIQYVTFLLGQYASYLTGKDVKFLHQTKSQTINYFDGNPSTIQLRERLQNSNELYLDIINSFPNAIAANIPNVISMTEVYANMPVEKVLTMIDHSDEVLVNPSLSKRIQRDYI
ncbi:MAG: hypothetical protein KAI26_00845 [Nanoarchaeota archaeon]|nr:hypothetical protein [Nanoarchaeota archaeon]